MTTKLYGKILHEVLDYYINHSNKSSCTECESGKLENYMTLHTEEKDIQFWECNNCEHQQTA